MKVLKPRVVGKRLEDARVSCLTKKSQSGELEVGLRLYDFSDGHLNGGIRNLSCRFCELHLETKFQHEHQISHHPSLHSIHLEANIRVASEMTSLALARLSSR